MSVTILLTKDTIATAVYLSHAVVFSGSVSAQAQAGEVVVITVTLPDNTTETLIAYTQSDKTYSVTKSYSSGNYSAKAHGDADAIYDAWDSQQVAFTVG